MHYYYYVLKNVIVFIRDKVDISYAEKLYTCSKEF